MPNLLEAENLAVEDLEAILNANGWADGWRLTDSEVRASRKPLYYRNSAPVVAPENKIKKSGQTHNLYAIYSITQNEPVYGSNKAGFFTVRIAITFYYDDAFLFSRGTNPFRSYISDVVDALADNLWVISSEGESPLTSPEDGNKYLNRKILFLDKTF